MIQTQEKNSSILLHLEKQQQEKMKLLIGLINPNETLSALATILTSDLCCGQQKLSGFNVQQRVFEKTPSKKILKELGQEGFPLVIFLQEIPNRSVLEWRMYDPLHAVMQKGKRMPLEQVNVAKTAHTLADTLWLVLTGQEGIFSTTIAYCLEMVKDKHISSDIYVGKPYNDTDAQLLVKGGKLLAPRWNKNSQHPLLLYSEITPSNIRLMSSTMDKKRRLVSNFDGLNMLPFFSSDGKKVAYCASYKGTSQIYCTSLDMQNKKRITQRLTHNAGNNTSPTLRDNGDIIFCSDFETKAPQLYYLHGSDGALERLSQSGYCACPNFSEKNGKIAYCKLVDATMQLFLYDLKTKQHKQLTFNKGNKDECCWSPCGNYLAFSVDENASSRIALLNLITQEQVFLTNAQQRCTYPSWSPCLS